jgi:hypothetical protein
MNSSKTILSNVDIINIAKEFDLKPLIYVGYKDLLNTVPKKDRLNKFYVVNLQSSNQGNGTHWCCFSTFSKHCVYFDSYAVKPPTNVINFISDLGIKKIAYWDKQIQSLRQTFCGWLCLMFLDFLYKGILKKQSLFTIMNKFQNDFKWNFDIQEGPNNYNIVVNYFNTL